MKDLLEIAGAKLNQAIERVVSDLQDRVGKAQAEFARRGVLHSSMHLDGVVRECCAAYDDAVDVISREIEWVMKQSFYVTESKARSLAEFGNVHLDPLTTRCIDHYERASRVLKNSGFLAAFEQRLVDKRRSAAEAIALFIRRWRAENQRNVLRKLLSIILGPLKTPYRS
ncbi:MAG: hypothetical protein A3H91_15120 [Gammaproteobacteria bacterium RIFCSPLOWO2_02_FULL_61_13]|nr:MAG: hypothetical protein A3H91_15120 [Gammaproteobacteria bacterium RIFCSPLOWO2_02_FULL_61_13]